MKRKSKLHKLLSLLLALVMIISAVPLSGISVFAAESGDFEYRILENGTAEITKYNGYAIDLVIPSEIDGYKVSSIGSDAFYYCTYLADIIIPNSVTSIGSDAFYGCTSLADIIIPNSVTSIGSGAFSGCTSLKSINIPNAVTSIGSYAFFGCTSLKSINIPNAVTSIGSYAFFDCTSLSDIIIPNSVTSIGEEAFFGCTSLTDIVIPDSVTSIEPYAFMNCTSLTDIVIPDNVTSIGRYAFENCTSLTEINIPDGVSFIDDHTFFGCKSLSSVMIPASVTDIVYYALGYVWSNNGEYEPVPGFKIYGYEDTVAEYYADMNGFEFIVLGKITDEKTGISVSGQREDIIPDGAQIDAKKISATDDKIVFDISLVKNGVEVQPNGEVIVKIPVPEGMFGPIVTVYREEADGTFTDMNAIFESDSDNGHMVFTTDHFSKYVITTTDPSVGISGDINGDGKVTAVDARWVLQIAAGTREVTEAERISVDLNGDGKVTAVDARWVLQIAAGTRVL